MVILYLVGVSHARHATHDTENVVVHGIHTDLSSGSSRNSRGRKDKLENSVIDSGEVARPAWLMFLRSQCERIHIDTGIRRTSVVLEGLDNIEVRTFALREAVLAVKLELSSDSRILTPAVEVKSGLSKNECAGIRESGLLLGAVDTEVGGIVKAGSATAGGPEVSSAASGSVGDVISTSLGEEAAGIDDTVGTGHRVRAAEGVDGVGKSIHGVGVVEGLGAEQLVEQTGGIEG